jgi:hypothetical protein
VQWCGFDYGETLMDPTGLRNHLLFGDTSKLLGEPERVLDKVRAYRVLGEAYGSYSVVKEGHRHEILECVLGGRPEAQEAFMLVEPSRLGQGRHLRETLSRLRNEGIVLDVVSEVKRVVGPVSGNVVSRFLAAHDLNRFFRHLITPVGKIELATNRVLDERCLGMTKGEGTIYDVLVDDLREQGIDPSRAVMIGDRPSTDIDPAHARGLKTIQYCGYVDRGPSLADARIYDFSELESALAAVCRG